MEGGSKIGSLVLLAVLIALLPLFLVETSARQRKPVAVAANNCVGCHARLATSAELSNRFLDWRLSPHKARDVTCDKCHGGDPAQPDGAKAHQGVVSPTETRSPLHRSNVAQTCGACHRDVMNSFVESNHYEAIKSNGLGPTCNSCHMHMASTIAGRPSQIAALCTFCHNTIDGLQPRKPEVPKRAQNTLESMQRAEQTLAWAKDLLAEAGKRRMKVDAEREDIRLAEMTLKEAKVGWHAFNLDSVSLKANKAFEEGLRVKELLTNKLGHD